MGQNAQPIGADQVYQLLMGIQHRGTDATGICLQYQDGSLQWHKKDEPAWKFLELPETQRFVEEHLNDTVRTVLVHTRASTKGSPTKMENNHPLTVGVSAVVHNGMISNDDQLFGKYKLKRAGQVDSDIIRAILDNWGLTPNGVRELNQMTGSAAFAAVSTQYPGKLLLARSGNPLVIGALRDEGLLIWASEKDAVHAAARPWVRQWAGWFKSNNADLLFNPVERETAMLWGDEGQEWFMDFQLWGRNAPVHRVYRCFEQYPDKSSRKREEKNRETVKSKEEAGEVKAPDLQKPSRMKCPNVACGTMIRFDKSELEKVPLWKLQCPSCKTPLVNEA